MIPRRQIEGKIDKGKQLPGALEGIDDKFWRDGEKIFIESYTVQEVVDNHVTNVL